MRRKCASDARVDRADEGLGRASELRELVERRAARPVVPAGIPGSSGSWVVSVTAATPRSSSRPCSPAANGIAEVDELRRDRGDQLGSRPICSATRVEARLHEHARRRDGGVTGDREPRLPAAADPVEDDGGDRALRVRRHARRSAGRRRRRTRRRRSRRARACAAGIGRRHGAPAAHSRARARSSAAVPDALSPSGWSTPALSRWATTMIASSARPGITVTTFRSSTTPRSGRSALQTSSSVGSPSARDRLRVPERRGLSLGRARNAGRVLGRELGRHRRSLGSR